MQYWNQCVYCFENVIHDVLLLIFHILYSIEKSYWKQPKSLFFSLFLYSWKEHVREYSHNLAFVEKYLGEENYLFTLYDLRNLVKHSWVLGNVGPLLWESEWASHFHMIDHRLVVFLKLEFHWVLFYSHRALMGSLLVC